MVKFFKKIFAKAEVIIAASSFLTYVFSLERAKNNFIEYDQLFIVLIGTVLFGLLTCYSLISCQRIRFTLSPISYCLFAILFLITVQVFFIRSLDWEFSLKLWFFLVLYVSYKRCLRHGDQIFILLSLFLTGIAVGIVMQIANYSFASNVLFDTDITSINPGSNANYLVAVAPFVLAIIIYVIHGNLRWRIWLISLISLIFISCSFMLLKSNARIAWIAYIISISCLLYYYDNRYKVPLKVPKMRPPKWVVLSTIILSIPILTILFYEYKPNSVLGRGLIYEISAPLTLHSPIIGLGLNRFESIYNLAQAEYLNTYDIQIDRILLADNVQYAFNEFLQITIEIGFIGLLITIITIYLIFNLECRSRNVNIYIICIGAKFSLLSILICSLFSYPFHSWSINVVAIFYLAILSVNAKVTSSLTTDRYWLICIPIFIASAGLEIRRYAALKKWENASHLAATDNFSKAVTLYKEIHPVLSKHGRFLFNYGSELSVAGRYFESQVVLEEAKRYYAHADLYLYLGHVYESLADSVRAESHFQISSDISPSKFTPKYYLLRFYFRTRQFTKAKILARNIINYPVKIPSVEVSTIKNYAIGILTKISSNETISLD